MGALEDRPRLEDRAPTPLRFYPAMRERAGLITFKIS